MPEDGIGLDGDNGSADDNDNDDEHNAISYFKECIFTEEAKLTRAHKDLRVAHLKLSTSERQVRKLTAKLMLQKEVHAAGEEVQVSSWPDEGAQESAQVQAPEVCVPQRHISCSNNARSH